MEFAIPKSKRTAAAVISLVVIVLSLGSLYYTMRPQRPRINELPFIGLGEILAEQTVAVVGQTGRIAIIRFQSPAGGPSVLDAQFKAFTNQLAQLSQIQVVADESVDPSEEMMSIEMNGLSPQRFTEMLAKHAAVDGIVSLVGLPGFSAEQFDALPASVPSLIVAGGGGMGLKAWLERDLVKVAIVPQFQPPPAATAEPTTSREWFDRFYMVTTPATAADLPL